MFVLIDNYDSFTFNLVHYLQDLGATVLVVRNDERTAREIFDLQPEGIILSPGPCSPTEAGICLEVVRDCPAQLPLLGVCLGHQAIGQAFGGQVVRAPQVVHGKTSAIHHAGQGVFRDLNQPFLATRYHSLIVDRASLPECLQVTAETDDGIIMGLQHRDRPLHGVQFHPESIASDHGHQLLRNFMDLTRQPLAA